MRGAAAAILLLAASTLLGQAPGDAETRRLSAEVALAHERGDFPRAIELGKALAARVPAAPGPAYNLACAYARAGDADSAAAWLKAAADRGFAFVATLLRDTDLDGIRAHPGYAAALEAVKRNNARRLEEFRKKAVDAVVVTVLPPHHDPSRPAPLLVALHGFGGTAADLVPVWRSAAAGAGAILLAPQGLDRAGKGFSWGIVEEGEHLILQAVERARREHAVDAGRVVLTGFSQGGGMAFTVALRHPGLFAGAIPVAGFYDHRVAPVPEKPPAKMPRFFIMNGAQDEEAANNRDAAARMKAAGVPVALRIYDGGHAFPPDRESELKKALAFVLEGAAPGISGSYRR